MASAVDICNLALSHIGDTAAVSSIDPPEGSAQAQHCARFYPIARNSLLEMAAWNFATKRATLAEVTNTSTEWIYAYAMPNGAISVIAIHPEGASDDYSVSLSSTLRQEGDGFITPEVAAMYTPQPYTIEVNSSGQQIILTNVPNAVARYTVIVTNTAQFPPLFVMALSWLLASMLAGPIIKGDTGAAEAKRCLAMFQAFKSQAEASDASQREISPKQVVPWIAGR